MKYRVSISVRNVYGDEPDQTTISVEKEIVAEDHAHALEIVAEQFVQTTARLLSKDT